MSGLRRWLGKQASDPFLASSWVAAAMIAGAFLSFFLAWRGTAATLAVQLQLPYLVSGGIGGVTLLIAGTALLLVQSRRRHDAREYDRLGDVLSQAEAALGALTAQRHRSKH